MEKVCSVCGHLKPIEDFYKATGTRDGRRGDCKSCNLARKASWYQRNREREIARVRDWQAANPDRVRATRKKRNVERRADIREATLLRKYGITQAEYEAILARQSGGCAICGDAPQRGDVFHVDHLDDTVRGILCVRCNNALGQLKERVDLAERAADYIDSNGFAPSGTYELRRHARDRALALRGA